MRQAAYLTFLSLLAIAGTAELALGLDGLLGHPPFVPIALVGGAWLAAFATVSLAEEVADWIGRKKPPVQKTTLIMPARLPFIDT
jgi:hypothetical protein